MERDDVDMQDKIYSIFRGMFDELYLQHFKALLGSRMYAIFREGEKLVLKPAKYASVGGYASALRSDDFLFLQNLPEDYKTRLMTKHETNPYVLSDLSYEEYLKTYEASMEGGKPTFKDWTWGIYVNPLYACLGEEENYYRLKSLRKFDYISSEKKGHLHYEKNELMYVMVDCAMGVVIGGNARLLREGTYWREGEEWETEEWHLNFFTTSIQYTTLTQFFKDFCEKNYKKDASGIFYIMPYDDIEKWEVTIRGRNHKLPIHEMYHQFSYNERTDYETRYIPTLYLMGKDGYKQRLE